ncbi:GTP-binding protein [Schistosoma japonicum]|uniref:GTP-binding protein n=1 Tax=Schistosoma japonicum TaxID=6182 RepID=A0A4Z2DS14_SCHJA|nr:GTP-binding protein GEM [Schistosoma japonicum]TNN19275.1 GTP-binding protein [Schistosoma japonicum]
MSTNQSLTPVIKRNQLTVAPSIEISLVTDEQTDNDINNDDSYDNERKRDKSPSEPSSFYKRSRDRQNSNRSSIHNNRSSSLRIDSDNTIDENTCDKNVYYQQQRQQHQHDDNYTDPLRNRLLSNQYLSTQNELNFNVESTIHDSPNKSSNNNNRRGKLIRQSRSFQNPIDHLNLSNSDNINYLSPSIHNQKKFNNLNNMMDEFDYFCHIANVPRDQEKDNSTLQSLHSTLSTSNIRSNSMRECSLERQKSIINYSTCSGSGQDNCNLKNTKFNKINYLKPPAKGQLRRANTEEDSLNKSLSLYKRPTTATLSYASMTNSYTNLCTTPPKSIPSVPDIMDEIHNPTSPLGVPLSSDSMSADEPGLTFYQVQVLGVSGVGKTLLCHQLAALVRGNSPSYDPDELDNKLEIYSITTALCGSVYTVNFVDTSAEDFENNLEVQIRDCIDAFIVVYAIDDQNSFEAAKLIINALIPLSDTRHRSILSSKAMSNSMTTLPGLIYLVGNKSDLVRGRQVSIDEGRHLASMHGAKFIEVSASLNHMVADLFILLIGHLHESEQRGRDPRLPADRRTNPLQSNLLTSSSKSITNSNIVNTFKIPTSTKASFSRFLKKHFTRSSQESD